MVSENDRHQKKTSLHTAGALPDNSCRRPDKLLCLCKVQILCPLSEDGEFTDLLSDNKETFKAQLFTGQFYNQDITAYKAAISLNMQPYAVKVIIKQGGYQHEET